MNDTLEKWAQLAWNPAVWRKSAWVTLSLIWAAAFLGNVTALGARDRTDEIWRALYVWPLMATVSIVYVRHLQRLAVEQTVPRYRVRGMLLLTAGIAVLSAVGHAIDAAVMLSFILFAYLTTPLVKRFVESLSSNRVKMNASISLLWISTLIVASFAALATIIAVGVMLIIQPAPDVYSEAWQSLTVFSALFAYFFILGDNARDGAQMVIYGLPVGLALNIVLGALTGLLLGKIATCSPLRQK
ncbi:MAG: hypothetical protein WD851_02215 [Pirellulales bacterium]